jgi:hypothetical protein
MCELSRNTRTCIPSAYPIILVAELKDASEQHVRNWYFQGKVFAGVSFASQHDMHTKVKRYLLSPHRRAMTISNYMGAWDSSQLRLKLSPFSEQMLS